MKKMLLVTGILIMVVACATVGRRFDTTHVNDVANGRQDKAQIEAWFGPPTRTIAPLAGHPAGCVERWQWTYAHAVAGGRTVSDSLVIDFDKAGKVCDHAYSTVNQ